MRHLRPYSGRITGPWTRQSLPQTDVYSTCLAVQNLWLAARAEGVGVGWVSIVTNDGLREIFGIPSHLVLVAYLCVGYPEGGFLDEPMLQKNGWRDRLPLDSLVRHEAWSRPKLTEPG